MCTALYMMALYDRACVGPTMKTSDGISIICLFRLILQAKSFVLFYLWYSSCFEVKCWIHTFPKRCSHIAMWIPILLITEVVMSILSNRCASFQVDPIISTFARSSLSFPTLFVSSVPKLALFSRPPTLFLQGLRFLNHVSFYLWEVSSFFSFNVLIRWFPMKMLNSFKFIILCSFFFSGGFNSSFRCWLYSFPCCKCFLMPMHLLIIHFSLFICSGVLKISQKARLFIPDPFKLFGDYYLIQVI